MSSNVKFTSNVGDTTRVVQLLAFFEFYFMKWKATNIIAHDAVDHLANSLSSSEV